MIIDKVCSLLHTKAYPARAKNLRREAWQLSLQHRKAIMVMEKIIPYLQGEKKEKAIKIVELYQSHRIAPTIRKENGAVAIP